MSSYRLLFIGNRRFVLEEILKRGLNLAGIIIIKGTHLEKDYEAGLFSDLPNVHIIESKKELLELCRTIPFDVFLSNGCPFILPIADMPTARYVNIHPSWLPDLRGVDPVIGAVLMGRDGGATCHIMDDGIDTGEIISQVRIPMTDDLDVTTLYQLSFVAEKQVFVEALARNFEPKYKQKEVHGIVYFSRAPKDKAISFSESNATMLRKIKAFNNRSQGCEFFSGGQVCKVFSATLLYNPYINEHLRDFDELEVVFSYENSIIFKKDNQAIRFENIVTASGDSLQVGDILSSL